MEYGNLSSFCSNCGIVVHLSSAFGKLYNNFKGMSQTNKAEALNSYTVGNVEVVQVAIMGKIREPETVCPS